MDDSDEEADFKVISYDNEQLDDMVLKFAQLRQKAPPTN
jgi:hypothetical protein